MAINPAGRCTVNPGELLKLCCDNVFKGVGETRMIHNLGKAAALQITSDPLMRFKKPARDRLSRKRGSKV
jgi:hypothetical protein